MARVLASRGLSGGAPTAPSPPSPVTVVCCLASRSGLPAESWAVDLGGGRALLDALAAIDTGDGGDDNYDTGDNGATRRKKNFVLLRLRILG